MGQRVTVKFVVPAGYSQGDYCVLYSNGGSGSVDTQVSGIEHGLFARGGIYGFGKTPFGKSRFGKGLSLGTVGFGKNPFGKGCFGHGSAEVSESVDITDCGSWLFSFYCYDEFGNIHTGTPEELAVIVHMAPDAPDGLTKTSYNKTTDILILSAA